MRKLLGVVGLMLLVTLPAMAQDGPRAEIFGGYSYLRADEEIGINAHGWNASATINANNWVGFTADFSGHYASVDDGEGGTIDVNVYSYTFGPRLGYRGERVNAFTHFLFGGARFGGGGISSETGFTMIFGGGADVKVNNNFAIRIFQADFVHTRFEGEGFNSFRFSTGVVVYAGGQ